MSHFSAALAPSPFIPLPLGGKGEIVLRGGRSPPLLNLLPPLKETNLAGVSKRGASLSSIKHLPPLLEKERGIQGVRFINNLKIVFEFITLMDYT